MRTSRQVSEPRQIHRRLAAIALLFALLFALVAAACGSGSSDDGDAADPDTDAGTDTGDATNGEPMNVLDAASQPDGTRVTVTGVLIDDTGTLFIADALAESFPPQPGGATLEVVDMDISQFDSVAIEGPIQWRDEPATIIATIEDGKLTDSRIIDQ